MDRYGPLKKGLQFTYLGLSMVAIVVLFVAGGYYLDEYFNVDGVFTVIGIIVGSLAGLGYFVTEIYRLATEGLDGNDEDHRNSRPQP